MNVDIAVEPDTVADFVIDFDACRSVVKAGLSGQCLLKPAVSVIPVISGAGQRVIGYLDPATLGTATSVSTRDNGNVGKATVPAADGRFVLDPVPPAPLPSSTASPATVRTSRWNPPRPMTPRPS